MFAAKARMLAGNSLILPATLLERSRPFWSITWSGGEPKRVDVGDSPKISAQGVIAYVRDGQIWIAPLNSSEKPKQLVVRGQNHVVEWSPDGTHLVFVSTRGDHSFIGIYDAAAKS